MSSVDGMQGYDGFDYGSYNSSNPYMTNVEYEGDDNIFGGNGGMRLAGLDMGDNMYKSGMNSYGSDGDGMDMYT